MDAPGRVRDVVNLRRLTLTDYKVDIPRLAPKKKLNEEFSKAGKLGVPALVRAFPAGRAIGRDGGNALIFWDISEKMCRISGTRRLLGIQDICTQHTQQPPLVHGLHTQALGGMVWRGQAWQQMADFPCHFKLWCGNLPRVVFFAHPVD